MITYVKGNLFGAPLNSVLAHSCNCKGTWGAGIALDFRKKFPMTYRAYQAMCKDYGKYLLGTALLAEENGYKIACLFNSSGYGDELDNESEILVNTYKSLLDLDDQLPSSTRVQTKIHMPKINSGLYKIDWAKTEKVLRTLRREYVVYEL